MDPSGFAWQAGANQSGERLRASTSGTGSPAHDDALLSSNVWESEPASLGTLLATTATSTTTTTPDTRNRTSPLHPGVFQPPPHSPVLDPTAANLPSDSQEAAVSDSNSDFELVDPNTPSHLDGAAERSNKSNTYTPTALKEQYSARARKGKQRQERFDNDEDEDWDTVPRAQQPAGTSRMEGGNDYEQPEWRQAGPNADAQDLAGPGEHGTLECTVTKPQKEGEGTQNVYVSYLVTTDVRSATPDSAKLR